MTKIKLLLSVLIVFLTFPVYADPPADMFNQANSYYADGEFDKAIDLYKEIIKSGYESGEVYYNLGNAYYKTGNIGRARLNYERALYFIDGDEALTQNIELLKLKLVDQIEEPPRLFLTVWWELILNIIDLNTLSKIVLVLFYIVLILLGLYLHNRKRGRLRMKNAFTVSLIIWLFTLIVWANKIYLFETEKYGVILSSTVTVHAEPSTETTELFVIHEGTRVKVERSSHDWFLIRLDDGKTGWVTQRNMEII